MSVLAGFLAQSFTSAILQPIEVIKTQILVNPKNIPQLTQRNQFGQIALAAKSIFHEKQDGSLIYVIRTELCYLVYVNALQKVAKKIDSFNLPIPKIIQNTGTVIISRLLSTIVCNPLYVIQTRKELLKNVYTCNPLYNPLYIDQSKFKFLNWKFSEHSAISIISELIETEGIRAFYKGYFTTVFRELSYLVAFFNTKRFLDTKIKNPHAVQFLTSFAATIISQPFEVIRNRIQVNSVDLSEDKQYTNIKDGFQKIIQHEGFKGLFSGLIIRSIKRPLIQTISFTLLQQIQKLFTRKQKQETF